jgi:prepilin-type processing-associated H-X9-DG protein
MRSSRGGILCNPPSEITPPPSGGKPWRGAWTVQRRYSYRHGDNNRINAAFFDGHVDSLWYSDHGQIDGQTYEGFTGPAVTPYYYYPSDSVVRKPEMLHKNTLFAGMKLQ